MASRVKEDLPAAHWAAFLQDETLQGLAAARTLLAAGMRQGSPEAMERAVTDAIRQIDDEIASLRGLMSDASGEPHLPMARRLEANHR